MNREERIMQLYAKAHELDAEVRAIFNELEDLEVFSISTIPDERQQILSALAADRLP